VSARRTFASACAIALAISAAPGCAKPPPPEPPPGSVAVAIPAAPTNKGPTFTVESAPPSAQAASGAHPATREDCEAITNRIVDLTASAEGMSGDALSAARADVKKRIGDDMREKCMGRSISDEALRCIQAATTVDDVTHRCLAE
jgi:hypothetical protein